MYDMRIHKITLHTTACGEFVFDSTYHVGQKNYQKRTGKLMDYYVDDAGRGVVYITDEDESFKHILCEFNMGGVALVELDYFGGHYPDTVVSV